MTTLNPGDSATESGSFDGTNVSITVRNFGSSTQQHCIELLLPPGLQTDPDVIEGSVGPKSRQSFKVKLTPDLAKLPDGVQMVPMDITLDGKHYGQLFDSIIQAHEPEKTLDK